MKKTLATISLLLSLLTANATHIVGGEFMYKYLSTSGGNKNYQVTLNLYIDCINGSQAAIDQDEYGLFNVFKVSNKALQVNLCKSVLRNTPSRVNDVNYKCIKNISLQDIYGKKNKFQEMAISILKQEDPKK